jgi:hypothetical protein
VLDHQPTHRANTDQTPLLTSTVLAVLLRVAGAVENGIAAHGLGYPERQVSVRIGDVVVYLRDPKVAPGYTSAGMARSGRRCCCVSGSPRPGCDPARAPIR